jgi:hypothetical protein
MEKSKLNSPAIFVESLMARELLAPTEEDNSPHEVLVSDPPTARGIVSWCHGDLEDAFIVSGVQRMLDLHGRAAILADRKETQQSEIRELRGALKELVETSGEANIPMVNAHAVRKMGKFLAATENAKSLLADDIEDVEKAKRSR